MTTVKGKVQPEERRICKTPAQYHFSFHFFTDIKLKGQIEKGNEQKNSFVSFSLRQKIFSVVLNLKKEKCQSNKQSISTKSLQPISQLTYVFI